MKVFVVTTILAAAGICGSLYAQDPDQRPPAGNGDILNMLRSRVPESTVLSELEVLVGRGANFDISPNAIIELQRAGASEKLLNTVIWMQTTIVPGIANPVPRGVFYRSGANALKLNSFLLWTDFEPRWASWPFYKTGAKEVAMNASPAIIHVNEPTPTLIIQGFDAGAGWQLVSMERGADYREVSLKRKHAFSSDFFSDSTFARHELHPIAVAMEGDKNVSVRPASPLSPGSYALCTQLPGGAGWMRACYEFQVVGM